MRNTYKSSALRILTGIAYVMLLVVFNCSAEGATVHFQSEGNAFKESELSLGEQYIGFVGDFVDIEDGTHNISINAPHGYTFYFELTVNGKELKITGTEHFAGNCKPKLEVRWPYPKIYDSTIHKGVKIITLSDPEFGEPIGRETTCALYSMAGCTKRKVILKAESEPSGAEIWIDGHKLPFQTNQTLSVPYCEYEKSKNVMLRMPNRVNCIKSIALSSDSKVSINCDLLEPVPVK